MGCCFVFGCSHRSDACTRNCRGKKCSLFTFPPATKGRLKWGKLCRRVDRPPGSHDRICSCHFKNGKKENGPTIFPWSKVFDFKDPEDISSKRPLIIEPVEEEPSQTVRYGDDFAAESSADGFAPESSADGFAPEYSADDFTPKYSADDFTPEYSADDFTPEYAHDGFAADSSAVEVPAPYVDILQDHTYVFSCREQCMRHMQELHETMRNQAIELVALREKVEQLNSVQRKKQALSITQIKDNEEKMVLFTSVTYDIFALLASILDNLRLNYFCGWTVSSLSLDDQLLVALMKLRHNYRDLDLADRFGISRTTISNVFHTFVRALHKVLCNKDLSEGAKSDEEPDSAPYATDTRETRQDIPNELDQQVESSVNDTSDVYPSSTSNSEIREHREILKQLTGKTHSTQNGKSEGDMRKKTDLAKNNVDESNERVNHYEITRHIPAAYKSISTKIIQVCRCLGKLKAPLLKEIAEKYTMETNVLTRTPGNNEIYILDQNIL